MIPGVVFVLKNVHETVNPGGQNRLHPFYMVYIGEDGAVVCDHLSPKAVLDRMRLLCKGQTAPDLSLCAAFDRETKDGRDMSAYSALLSDAIDSIVHVREESELDAFLRGRQMSFFESRAAALDDFELICFLVVRERG